MRKRVNKAKDRKVFHRTAGKGSKRNGVMINVRGGQHI